MTGPARRVNTARRNGHVTAGLTLSRLAVSPRFAPYRHRWPGRRSPHGRVASRAPHPRRPLTTSP
jgi:hypothetical protein